MDWISKLPQWAIALSLTAMAASFVYVLAAQPPLFVWAGLDFGFKKKADPLDAPLGAVVAFDTGNACPEGWTKFDPAAGRFLIGVDGGKYKLPYVDGKPEYVTGGAETHLLTVEEMPSHQHNYANKYLERQRTSSNSIAHHQGDSYRYEYNEQQLDTTSFSGGVDASGQNAGEISPHNNMPPYIALYFCKKD